MANFFKFFGQILIGIYTVNGVFKARILKWFAIPLSSGPHSVRPLHHDPSILGGPTRHGLVSLSETSCGPGSDWLVFCDHGFSVSALWCPLTTPTILLGFLLPRTWGISSWLLQQSAAAAPYLGRGRPSWPWGVQGQEGRLRVPGCDGAGAAERGYPMSEVRSSWEEQPHVQGVAAVQAQEAWEQLLTPHSRLVPRSF